MPYSEQFIDYTRYIDEERRQLIDELEDLEAQ